MMPDAAGSEEKLVDHFDRQYRNEKLYTVMKLTKENNMHLEETVEGPARMQQVNDNPGGPGFHSARIAEAHKMEIWGSGFKDEGADFCEFRLIDNKGRTMQKRRISGY